MTKAISDNTEDNTTWPVYLRYMYYCKPIIHLIMIMLHCENSLLTRKVKKKANCFLSSAERAMAEYMPTSLATAGLCFTCPKCCDKTNIAPASVSISIEYCFTLNINHPHFS